MEENKSLIEWAQENKTVVSKPIKYGLLFFSYLFWIIGAVFAAVGGWSVSQKVGFNSISDFATEPGAILAAVGCLIFIISSFGVLGSWRENICYLRMYKLFLVTILVFEFCAGLVGFAFWPEVKKVIDNNISLGIERYTDNTDLRNMIDMIQRKFECCGSLTIDDWDSNPYFNCRYGGSYRSCGVPWSCCLQKYERNRQCGYRIRKKRSKIDLAKEIHTIGCLDKLFEFMRVNMFLIGGLAIAGNLPLLVGIYLAHRLIKQIRKLIEAYNSANEKYHMVENSQNSTALPFSGDVTSSSTQY